MLRPGNAGANNGRDHLVVMDQAIDQLPPEWRKGHQAFDDPTLVVYPILMRSDSAGATHDTVDACLVRNLELSIGMAVNGTIRDALMLVQEENWVPAIETNGQVREGAWVTELTELVDLSEWGEGLRLICRRERPHPGAQLTLFDTSEGFRHQCFLTNSAGEAAALELRHRGHARVEDRIRTAKDMGLENLPFSDLCPNENWVALVLAAMDLFAWTKRICLDGDLAKAEPKRLRYALFHLGARIVRSGRRIIVRIQKTWPSVKELTTAFERLRATIPAASAG
jgi:hypothetical protein